MDVGILKNKTILLVEDDIRLRDKLVETLEIFFYDVLIANSCRSGYEVYSSGNVDIILSDIKMPNCSGIELVKKIRETDYQTPIILLTGNSELNTIVEAANSGIDGYIIKPFILEDFLKCVLRAANKGTKVANLNFADGVYFDIKSKLLYKNEQNINLSSKEQLLLMYFVVNKDRILSKDEIMRHVWAYEDVGDAVLKNLMSRFRKKISIDLFISMGMGKWKLRDSATIELDLL